MLSKIGHIVAAAVDTYFALNIALSEHLRVLVSFCLDISEESLTRGKPSNRLVSHLPIFRLKLDEYRYVQPMGSIQNKYL